MYLPPERDGIHERHDAKARQVRRFSQPPHFALTPSTVTVPSATASPALLAQSLSSPSPTVRLPPLGEVLADLPSLADADIVSKRPAPSSLTTITRRSLRGARGRGARRIGSEATRQDAGDAFAAADVVPLTRLKDVHLLDSTEYICLRCRRRLDRLREDSTRSKGDTNLRSAGRFSTFPLLRHLVSMDSTFSATTGIHRLPTEQIGRAHV